jgi:hypothetical protein
MKVFYKVLTGLLALSIFPAVIFFPFFKIIVTSTVLSFFTSSTGEPIINGAYSLKDIYDLILPYKDTVSSFSLSSIPENVRDALGVPAAFFIGFFILALLSAIIVFILSVFTKKKTAVMAFSGLGIAFTLGMNIAFESFAKPLINGKISIVELLGETVIGTLTGSAGSLGSLFSSLLGSSALIDLRLFNLSAAYIAMLLIFGTILVFTIVSVVTDWE